MSKKNDTSGKSAAKWAGKAAMTGAAAIGSAAITAALLFATRNKKRDEPQSSRTPPETD